MEPQINRAPPFGDATCPNMEPPSQNNAVQTRQIDIPLLLDVGAIDGANQSSSSTTIILQRKPLRSWFQYKLCRILLGLLIVIPIILIANYAGRAIDSSSSNRYYHGNGPALDSSSSDTGSHENDYHYNPGPYEDNSENPDEYNSPWPNHVTTESPVTDNHHTDQVPDYEAPVSANTHFTLSSNTIKHIRSPDGYLSYQDRIWTWTFTGPESAKLFVTFSIKTVGCAFKYAAWQCGDDTEYLEIRDGNNKAATLLNKFCYKVDMKRITSSGNTLYMKLKTLSTKQCEVTFTATINIDPSPSEESTENPDSSYNPGPNHESSESPQYNNQMDPLLNYETPDSPNTHFTLSSDSSKYIRSPAGFLSYQDKIWTWTFTGPESAKLFVTFSIKTAGCFSTSEQCVGYTDYLEIRDGSTKDARLLDKFCIKVDMKRITSSGNTLYMELKTLSIKQCEVTFTATINIAKRENDICNINTTEGSTAVDTFDRLSDCGKQAIAPISERIVGGREAIPHSWPWQIVLEKLDVITCNHKFICGGSIISNQWILTAAHCVYGHYKGDYEVVAGVHDRKWESGKRFQAAEVNVHHGYNPGTLTHDIALIKLNEPIDFGQHISPVCLPTAPLPDNKGAIITGWGLTEELIQAIMNDNMDIWRLNQALVHVIPWEECKRDLRKDENITRNMFCAGERYGGKDSCQGDSGGPLVSKAENEETWSQYGITSFGHGCGEAGKPGVYTQVVNYLDWIANITKGTNNNPSPSEESTKNPDISNPGPNHESSEDSENNNHTSTAYPLPKYETPDSQNTHFTLRSNSSKTIRSPFIHTLRLDRVWTWIITGPESSKLSLTVSIKTDGCSSKFTYEQCDDTSDYLEIRDGSTEDARLLNKYCFDKKKSRMTSGGNSLYLRLKTLSKTQCVVSFFANVNILE